MHILPICPRPYPREAACSWLTRVARVYALSADRLVGILGLVPFASNSRRFLARPVEVALEDFNQLATATQLPPVRLLEMRPDPLEWTVTDTDVCTVCGLCLDEDLCHGRDPYLRAEWRQSWRIFCSIHEVRLLACPMTVFTTNASEASVIEEIDEVYAHCDPVQDNINRAFSSNRDFFHLTSAIEEMEMVIRRAIAGEVPDAFTWGPLRASDFLQTVQDVTSWALTNFEAFKARPAAEELLMVSAVLAVLTFERRPGFSRHTTPMPLSEPYLRSTTLPCGARRSGGPLCYSPGRTPAATQPD